MGMRSLGVSQNPGTGFQSRSGHHSHFREGTRGPPNFHPKIRAKMFFNAIITIGEFAEVTIRHRVFY
jgi:hypothetical protein